MNDFGMTSRGVANLLWIATVIMSGAALLLIGQGCNAAVAAGIALIGDPLLWFTLCLIIYWPRDKAL